MNSACATTRSCSSPPTTGRKGSGRTRGSTGGLRGRKRDDHEGGIRVAGLVRWPGQIAPGTVSKVPVIGSDIFSTALGIAGIDLPGDRTIDGVDIRPAFKGQPVERKVPLFWRTHIAPEKSHAAMRIGDWKIVADRTLSEFQLYEIEKDWQEKHDLAAEKPEKLAEMKTKFMEVWRGIEAEGPRDWWENEALREEKNNKRARPKKKEQAGKLGEGKDETGDWPIVRGGTVAKSELGYRLSSHGEAFAVRPLDKPLTGNDRAVFKLNYRSAFDAKTRNAMFCFGEQAANGALIKVGTAIGMGAHAIFEGGWANVQGAGAKATAFDAEQTFAAHVMVDLGKRTVVLEIGETRLEEKLPENLKEVKFIGVYTKATTSDFSAIDLTGRSGTASGSD